MRFGQEMKLLVTVLVGLGSHAAHAYGPVEQSGSPSQSATLPAQQILVTGDRERAARHGAMNDLGSPGSADSVDKIVRLDPGSKYANVEWGTSVEFVRQVAGSQQSFVWRFDGWPRNVINLNEVAPAGFLDHPVLVYISPDPTYLGGG
jgi:hypothetical protein